MANEKLRRLREATPSPSGNGLPMTRAEAAEAVNEYVWNTTGKRCGLDADMLARYERGKIRWPGAMYRNGLRAVLGAETDADLGFQPTPRGRAAALKNGTSERGEFDDPFARLSRMSGADTLASSASLGSDFMDVTRRALLGAAAWSAISLTVPEPVAASGRRVGASDVARVRATTVTFSRADQRHGGGHQRTLAVEYLSREVLPLLNGTFGNASVRRTAFSAASELAYLAGWMAFDDGEHGTAQGFFGASVRLAQEADDSPMAAHTLRAMAHQALELEHVQDALVLAEASVDRVRYRTACPRERALLGVVHARALAASGLPGAASAALLRAEDDLAQATPGDDEPSRVFFFSEASLAHETGRALYLSGDLTGAETALTRSVRIRAKQAFARTHAVTLGYLGEIQAASGRLDQACATWSEALDAMADIRSARARSTVITMRRVLEPLVPSDPGAADLDARAANYLATA